MQSTMRFFRGSFLVTLIGLALAFWLGGPEAMIIAAILSVLEVSLSFDNAVVNATVLKDMTPKWQRRFITWGMLIAVFGMRIIFPVVVVSVIAQMAPWTAFQVAVSDPDTYAHHLTESHVTLMGFGGAFLMMVGLDFFLDDEKEHWVHTVESLLVKLGAVPFMADVLTLLMAGGCVYFLPEAERRSFFIAVIIGVLIYRAIHLLSGYMENREQARAATHAAKSGLGMFLYLEVLDASFSFDGVIGAFAITNQIFIIAIGLGIGAMFVRSLTIMLVEKGTLAEYQYLEHGAFYAIVALASIMMLKSFLHIPELVTGFVGAMFIAVAFVHSLIIKRRDEAQAISS